ncbi:MAG: DUF2267 domain-containing protein [Alphaproteobacteria bacterium]
MSATGLPVFDETVQLTNIWLNELMEAMGWTDRHRAYLGLRVTLQQLRDHLPVDEAAHLGAQLPMLVRGFYYEGWHPAHKPLKARDQDAFLIALHNGFRQLPTDEPIDPAAVAGAVFGLVGRRIAAGEARQVREALPRGIRALWPEPAAAAHG